MRLRERLVLLHVTADSAVRADLWDVYTTRTALNTTVAQQIRSEGSRILQLVDIEQRQFSWSRHWQETYI